MRTGKLSISRGYQAADPAPAAPRLTLVPRQAEPVRAKAKPAPAPVTPEYKPAHDRLAALERLARLAKQGALTAEEFAFEKARLLGHFAAEAPFENSAPSPSPRAPGPSLVGRLLGWKFIPVGLAAGLALSFASQPQQTLRFFDEALRLLGA